MPNRSMVHVFEHAGMQVRYVEARDGHSWENWRDRLRDALSWVYPGPAEVLLRVSMCRSSATSGRGKRRR